MTTIPACPNCGATDWECRESGIYYSHFTVKLEEQTVTTKYPNEPGRKDEVHKETALVFQKNDGEETCTQSEFVCMSCHLGDPYTSNETIGMTEDKFAVWDKVVDELYELRDEAEWRDDYA